MNTSAPSVRTGRQGLRTTFGATLPRVGIFLEKLWALSERESLPAHVCSRELAQLSRGMVRSLERADGITHLEVMSGLVWVTGTPACGDTILRGGEVYELGEQWPYVIEALADAEFVASGPDATKGSDASVAI